MTEPNRAPRITVYTTAWCPFTRRVRTYLEEHGLAWTEVDIEADAAAARQVEAWNAGSRTVPTVEIDGRVLTNPRAPQLDEALGLSAGK